LDNPPYSKAETAKIWDEYFSLKGPEWMKEKKAEMNKAIDNGNLDEWIDQGDSKTGYPNYNVYLYYLLNDETPPTRYYRNSFYEEKEMDVKIFAEKKILKINDQIVFGFINNNDEDIYLVGYDFFSRERSFKVDSPQWHFDQTTTGFLDWVGFEPKETKIVDIGRNKQTLPGEYWLKMYFGFKSPFYFPTNQFILKLELDCKEGFEFIQKINGDSACVKPDSVQKLIERGWAKS